MNSFSQDEKEFVFDCCGRLPGVTGAIPAKALLTTNEEAASLYAQLQAALGPLESLAPASCPVELVERTVRRLCVTARAARAAGGGEAAHGRSPA